MTKTDLLSQLENAKNNYILGLAAISLFSNGKTIPILNESSAKFGQYTLNFKDVGKLLSIKSDLEIATKEFLTSQIRALIKESFELIKEYCESSKQNDLLVKQDWYQFARMIRNCLSHNFKFEFNDYDKKKLPVSWKGKTIDIAKDGTPLKLEFFGYVETWELFSEFQNFVKDKLT